MQLNKKENIMRNKCYIFAENLRKNNIPGCCSMATKN